MGYNLAYVLEKEGDTEEALLLYKSALEKVEMIQPVDHFNIGLIHNNIGYLLKYQNDLDAAREHYSKSMHHFSECDECDYFQQAATIYNAARLEIKLENLEGARKMLEEARTIVEGNLDEDHTLFSAINDALEKIEMSTATGK